MPHERESLNLGLPQAPDSRCGIGAGIKFRALGGFGPRGDLGQDLRGLPGALEGARQEQVDFRKPPCKSRCRLSESVFAFGAQRSEAIIRPTRLITFKRDRVAHDDELYHARRAPWACLTHAAGATSASGLAQNTQPREVLLNHS